MTTQTQVKHTPPPWKITNEDLRSDDHRNRPHIWGEGNVLAICHTTEDEFLPIEQARANAEFIVRAVNSHKALLEAAKEARQALVIKGPDREMVIRRLDQAIDLAEGR